MKNQTVKDILKFLINNLQNEIDEDGDLQIGDHGSSNRRRSFHGTVIEEDSDVEIMSTPKKVNNKQDKVM